MAKKGRTPNRLELRKAAEAAEKRDGAEGKAVVKKARVKKADDGTTPVKKAAKKAPTKRVKKSKKSEPVRLRRVWGVFDNNNQQVAVFPFKDKPAADQKCKDLNDKGKSVYFVQPVNEPIPAEPPKPAE
jgi:hypothetical protein